jgi:polyhydroxybutyrate depolymerase
MGIGSIFGAARRELADGPPTRHAARDSSQSYDPTVRRIRVLGSLALGIPLSLGLGGGTAASGRDARIAPRPSTGCKAAAVAPGVQRIDTNSGGASRFYLRHVPPSYDGRKPVPLVVDLHGYLEGAELHEINSRLGAFGDGHGFVTITPQGSGAVVPGWDVERDAPDVRFIGDLLDETVRTLCIDDRRIFVTGFSNGAFLASTLACVYAERIAAIAPVAALRDPPGCKPARPVPIVTFAGTGDEFVAFTGGLGARAQVASANDGTGRMLGDTSGGKLVARSASMPQITAAWAKRNHCATKPKETTVAADVTLVRYRCPKNADVELYRIEGGGHTWPGSAFSRQIEVVVGATTFSIDANEVMWAFFQAHPLRGK